MYKALTYIVLNNQKYAPGTKFTQKELLAAGQSKSNIEQLIKDKALSKDMEAPLHKDHQPITLKITKTDSVMIFGHDAGVGNG